MVHGGYKREDNMIHMRQRDHGNQQEAALQYGDISAPVVLVWTEPVLNHPHGQ